MGAAPLAAAVAATGGPNRIDGFTDEHQPDAANIFDYYEIGGLLGSGSFGQVRLCCQKNGNLDKQGYAVKVVDTKGAAYIHAASFISARQEASILKSVRHPHVVELVDIFEKDRWLFLVMERVSGGELFGAFADPCIAVTEGTVACVGRQLLQALSHLHDRDIVHRDVKAENIMLAKNPTSADGWHIKLIDFGLAMRMEQPACLLRFCGEEEGPPEELVCGTAYYCAPEVWVNDYGPKVDVWAAGVVLYLALHGAFPFYDNDASNLEALICDWERQPSFRPACMKDCPSYRASAEACSCLEGLLEKDQDLRSCAAAALLYPWLVEEQQPQQEPSLRGGSLAVPRPKALSDANLAARSLSANCSLPSSQARQPIPVPVRLKAGRAAVRPAVDVEEEQSRTEALEALKMEAASEHACKKRPLRTEPGASGVATPRSNSCSTGISLLPSWTDRDVQLADASLTDSDVDWSPGRMAMCTCR